MRNFILEYEPLIVQLAALGHTLSLKALLTEQNVNTRAKNGLSILAIAAFFGHLDTVRLLLSSKGVQISAAPPLREDYAEYFGVTALSCAAMRGNHPIAEALISAGANVEKEIVAFRHLIDIGDEDENGDNKLFNEGTLLHLAADDGYLDGVNYLLTFPALKMLISTKNDYQRTPLVTAARCGHQEIVTVLANAGASINEIFTYRSNDDVTILTEGAAFSPKGVHFLLTFPELKNIMTDRNEWNLAINAAEMAGKGKIMHLLKATSREENARRKAITLRSSSATAILHHASSKNKVRKETSTPTVPTDEPEKKKIKNPIQS